MIPIGTKIIIKKTADVEKSNGGLYLPSSGQRLHSKGVVAACQDEFIDNGVARRMPFRVGDTVVYTTKAATRFEHDPDLYWIELVHILYVEK